MKNVINNLPASPRKYIVTRFVDGEHWFWGSYDERSRANEVATEIDGTVFMTSIFQKGAFVNLTRD